MSRKKANCSNVGHGFFFFIRFAPRLSWRVKRALRCWYIFKCPYFWNRHCPRPGSGTIWKGALDYPPARAHANRPILTPVTHPPWLVQLPGIWRETPLDTSGPRRSPLTVTRPPTVEPLPVDPKPRLRIRTQAQPSSAACRCRPFLPLTIVARAQSALNPRPIWTATRWRSRACPPAPSLSARQTVPVDPDWRCPALAPSFKSHLGSRKTSPLAWPCPRPASAQWSTLLSARASLWVLPLRPRWGCRHVQGQEEEGPCHGRLGQPSLWSRPW